MRLLLVLALLGCDGPILTTPRHLVDDLTEPRPELLDKYRDGATFSGVIKTVGSAGPERPVVWIEVDGTSWLMLELAPPPPPDLRAGAVLTVTCQIGGATGALLVVTDCVSS